jgi:hypothetical protein
VWILGANADRLQVAADAIRGAGHQVKIGEPVGGDLANALKDFRPDVIVIDMAEQPERGRHLGAQFRADRATRQLPIILVGIGSDEGPKAERGVTGPTRRYANALDSQTVLNALICDL